MEKYKSNNALKIIILFLSIIIVLTCGILLFTNSSLGDTPSVTSIKKTSSNGLVDTYTITYSNGTTSFFTVTNGQNGENADKISIEKIYQSAVDSNVYAGSFSDFLKDYLSFDEPSLQTSNINKALLSAVSIYCEFPVITQEPVYIQTPFGYIQSGTQDVKTTQLGAGSGVIYNLDKANGNAYIITNYHVVYNKDCINENKIGKVNVFLYGYDTSIAYKKDAEGNKVINSDGYPIVEYSSSAIECEYVGGSLTYDIAVLKIVNSEILKNSCALKANISTGYTVGETAVAIGNPEALGISVTSGVVSVDSEYITMKGADETTIVTLRTLRIDTAINSGNSGGGLFNSKGELIGIVNAKLVSSDIENIAYAIPKDIAISVADNLIYNFETNSKNKVQKVYMGLTMYVESSKAIWNETTQTTQIVENVVVDIIDENSLADILNFEVGDKVLSIKIGDNELITPTRMFQIIDSTLKIKVGDDVIYSVLRGTDTITISFTATSDMFVEVQ